MTLIVAIKAVDGVIVAADSRGTIGDPRGLTAVNDTQQKLFQFGKCGLAIAGVSEMALAIIDELGKRNLDNPGDIDQAVNAFREAAVFSEEWYRGIHPENRPSALFILGGYRLDTAGGPPMPLVFLLNSTDSFAPQLGNNYPMMAGVPQYAVYLSHRYYDPEMSVDNAAALAEYLISETASQDPKVGGPIKISRITPDGFYQFTDDEVAKLQERNKTLNERLKTFFKAEEEG